MTPKVDISDGTTHSTDAGNVRIVSKANMTAAFVKPASNKKKVTVPATVNVAGRTFKVAAIDAGAFKGMKTTTLIVKTKKLTKKSVTDACTAAAAIAQSAHHFRYRLFYDIIYVRICEIVLSPVFLVLHEYLWDSE